MLPLFALFNAGLVLDFQFAQDIGSPVGLGIIPGLFVGKQIGIMLGSWLVVRAGHTSPS